MSYENHATGSWEWDDLTRAARNTPRPVVAAGHFATAFDDPMGPFPGVSVQVFTDLGLSNAEIARYFRVSEKRITDLKTGRGQPDGDGRLRRLAATVRGKLLDGAGQ